MILPVSNFRQTNIRFKAENQQENENYDEGGAPEEAKDVLVANNMTNRALIGMDKLTKAFSTYPVKGIKGSINSNFYEFLTMGNVPFILGSLTMMSVFNSANKHFSANAAVKASKLGTKMALGVFLYAVAKDLSKVLITKPIQMVTGIDTELPYEKVNRFLPEYPGQKDGLTSIEYHKVGESVDFPRWDLLYIDPKDGERNARYDKIAKKNGLGTNLNDSDQDVKPMYKEVLIKSKLAKSFSSFMWAVSAVALAFQKPWEGFFKAATLKFWKTNDFKHSLKAFWESLKESSKQLYHGAPEAVSKVDKHAGKVLLGATVLTTIFGVLNSIHITKKPQKPSSTIDHSKESVVC